MTKSKVLRDVSGRRNSPFVCRIKSERRAEARLYFVGIIKFRLPEEGGGKDALLMTSVERFLCWQGVRTSLKIAYGSTGLSILNRKKLLKVLLL